MTIVNFTPLESFIGGMIIASAASILLISIGKICGISGITGSFLDNIKKFTWQHTFILGLVVGGGISIHVFNFSHLENNFLEKWQIIIGGLLVGFGTRYGRGCTSGHGVCGIPRASLRSIVATIIFMISGIITVFFIY